MFVKVLSLATREIEIINLEEMFAVPPDDDDDDYDSLEDIPDDEDWEENAIALTDALYDPAHPDYEPDYEPDDDDSIGQLFGDANFEQGRRGLKNGHSESG